MREGSPLILLTGATGYVGGRLRRALEESGRRVRCLARHPENLLHEVALGTEVVRGDCADPASLDAPLIGVRPLTTWFTRWVRARISRSAIARARATSAKRGATRASRGSSISAGSATRARISRTICAAGRRPARCCARLRDCRPAGSIIELGGADAVSYGDIMREYALQRGLKRRMIPVPVLTPYFSSMWLGLTTPVYARIGRKLIESVRNPTVVRNDSARRLFPAIRPMGLCDAIARATANEDREIAETHWADAISSSGLHPLSYGGQRFGPRLIGSHARTVPVPPDAAPTPIGRAAPAANRAETRGL